MYIIILCFVHFLTQNLKEIVTNQLIFKSKDKIKNINYIISIF